MDGYWLNNLEFGKFYEALYNTSKTDPRGAGDGERYGRKEIWEYIEDASMPTLPKTIIDEIERPIRVEELSRAIATLPLGKSPGPDGLTNLYYKKFLPVLVKPLCNYFNSINASNPVLPEALLAYLTVLPKGGKDPQICANYRPISLLNSDTKLLAKILALRLQEYIGDLVRLDQTGFMKGR